MKKPFDFSVGSCWGSGGVEKVIDGVVVAGGGWGCATFGLFCFGGSFSRDLGGGSSEGGLDGWEDFGVVRG